MKKIKKVLIGISVVFISLCFSFAVGVAIILEPNVKINGFATLDTQKLDNLKKNTRFLSFNGENISYGIQNKEYVKLDNLPAYVPNAFIAIEDKRFYSHNGVDYVRILGALKNNIVSGSYAEGASTISQQLIKNTHLKSDKTLSRKVQEIRIAKDLERNYSKKEILEMYLNALNFGGNVYGINNAVKTFFGKDVEQLSLSESATLAGIINSPTKLNPFNHYDNCKLRRNTVLKRMFEQNMINQTEYEKAKNSEIELSRQTYYVNQYLNGALNEVSKVLGKEKNKILLSEYKIKTYCDNKLQKYVQNLVNSINVDNVDVSVVVANNKTNKVIAFASTDFFDATTLRRQPGSTLKPFVAYVPALENKYIYPCSKIYDERTDFDGYSPRNYKDKYYGYVSAKNALALSLNVPSVKLLETVGVENSIKFLRKAGLNVSPTSNKLSLALGNVKEGLTLNEIVDAYKTFAKNGIYKKSNYVEKIVDKNGKIIFSDNNSYGMNIMSDDTAFLINDMLHECTKSGTAKKIGYAFDNVCAKTGTVGNKNGNTDAYCVAYTPTYSLVVRLNAKSGLMDNKFSGGNLPTSIAVDVLKYLDDKQKFVIPQSVVSAEIDGLVYEKENDVVIADSETLPKNRIRMFFSKKNMPRYKNTVTYTQRKSILDDFDNFEIIDSVVD